MSKRTNKELEKEWKKLEQGEMKEEDHELELKEGYEQDEEMRNQKTSHFYFNFIFDKTHNLIRLRT